MKTLFGLLVVLLLPVSEVSGQSDNSYVQIGMGPESYFGDLRTGSGKWRMQINFGLLFNKKKRLNGSVQLTVGSVTGQSDSREFNGTPDITPNTYFKTNLFALNYELHYNIIRNEFWKIYLGQGFGLMFFTPKDQFGGNLRDQADTREAGESYGSVTVILPTKLGLIYFLPNAYGLGFETGIYNTFSDYIDNVSAWGDHSGYDNIWYFKFSLNIPVRL
jgi:hypothetical protein